MTKQKKIYDFEIDKMGLRWTMFIFLFQHRQIILRKDCRGFEEYQFGGSL